LLASCALRRGGDFPNILKISRKKRAGREALLKKLCRPYFPEKFGFDFD
jgi:hypothetical protein